ncbi:MAG: PEP-CTERM sorting domain-containing protein [Verrucomicrobiales bacterium]
MIRSFSFFLLAASLLGSFASLHGAILLSPLATFGGGDGYIAPGEVSYLGTGSLERGLAYNPTTGNLILVSRVSGTTQNIKVLDGATGADLGTLNNTGISGGTFAANKVSVGTDGAIYVANLASFTAGVRTPFKIYRYESEAAGLLAGPTVAFSTTAQGPRLGDSFDVIGGGATITAVTGQGNNSANVPPLPSGNAYEVFTSPDGGLTLTQQSIVIPTNPPALGDFRLGITFTDSSTSVLGTQGTAVDSARLTNYDPTSGAGTLLGSLTLTTSGERIFDYAVVGGTPLLATLETTTSTVRIYDFTDPLLPVLQATGNLLPGASLANTISGGQLAFGAITGNTATLYALNTSNGIQAFQVTIPEPSSALLLGLAGAGMIARRRRR